MTCGEENCVGELCVDEACADEVCVDEPRLEEVRLEEVRLEEVRLEEVRLEEVRLEEVRLGYPWLDESWLELKDRLEDPEYVEEVLKVATAAWLKDERTLFCVVGVLAWLDWVTEVFEEDNENTVIWGPVDVELVEVVPS